MSKTCTKAGSVTVDAKLTNAVFVKGRPVKGVPNAAYDLWYASSSGSISTLDSNVRQFNSQLPAVGYGSAENKAYYEKTLTEFGRIKNDKTEYSAIYTSGLTDSSKFGSIAVDNVLDRVYIAVNDSAGYVSKAGGAFTTIGAYSHVFYYPTSDKLYAINSGFLERYLYSCDKDGSNAVLSTIVGIGSVYISAFDIANSVQFYVNGSDVKKMNFNSNTLDPDPFSTAVAIITIPVIIYCLFYHEASAKVYYAGYGKVGRFNADGSSHEVIYQETDVAFTSIYVI